MFMRWAFSDAAVAPQRAGGVAVTVEVEVEVGGAGCMADVGHFIFAFLICT